MTTSIRAADQPTFLPQLQELLGPNPQMRLTRWLFLRGLGLIYLIAFISYTKQALSLIGANGIVPLQFYLPPGFEEFGVISYLRLPTLFWINHSDPFIMIVCIAGIIASVLLIIGVAQRWVLLLLYILYLSLMNGSQTFIFFSDALLLEAGILAIFLAPPQLRPLPPSQEEPPLMAVVFMLRWLLFRLIFGAGMAKLAFNDPAWETLSAVAIFYEVQPLPTPLAWLAGNYMPLWASQAAALATFFFELVVPFSFFMPRRIRLIGAALTAFFQLMLMLIGNFGFLNWLAIILCISLLDDQLLYNIAPKQLTWFKGSPAVGQPSPLWRRFTYGFLAIPLILSLIFTPLTLRWFDFLGVSAVESLQNVQLMIQPYYLANVYPMFARIDLQRHEIVFQGSNDGVEWQDYDFYAAPGDLSEGLRFIAPYDPRLDWHMAAIGVQGDPPVWVENMVVRLLEGNEQTLRLVEHNPFPDEPPLIVQVRRYNYEFTSPEERQSTGNSWFRRDLGEFYPMCTLQGCIR